MFAVVNGVETIHVSVNGIGEMTGNASLEQTVMALKLLYGVELNVKTERLIRLAKLVEEPSMVRLEPLHPVVGDRIFHIESGIVAGSWANVEHEYPNEIFPFLHQLVGHEPVKIVIGKKTGRDSLIYKLRKLGIEVSEQELKWALHAV